MATPSRQHQAHAYDSYLVALLLPVLSCCLLRSAVAQQSRPVGETELLLQIKHAWGDPPALASWNWSPGAGTGAGTSSACWHHCCWPHVACDPAGRVTGLALAGINITGPVPVPDAVCGLSRLTRLDLSNNSISGAFPTALYRCTSLRYLDLSKNHLAGALPRDIGHGLAASLRRLDLSGNQFSGTIPESLRNLRYLALDGDNLVGAIPPASLSCLWNLRHLTFCDNHLTGTIVPDSLSMLKNLRHLILNHLRRYISWQSLVS